MMLVSIPNGIFMTLIGQNCPFRGTVITDCLATSSAVMLSQSHLFLLIHGFNVPEKWSSTKLTNVTRCPLRGLYSVTFHIPTYQPTVFPSTDQSPMQRCKQLTIYCS